MNNDNVPRPFELELSKLEIHPLAKLFPLLSDADYKKLKADILKNGQIEPIIVSLDEKFILDGRHRLKACLELEREPKWEYRDVCGGHTDEDYIWARNVLRRHLTDDQRAMLAAKWADTIREMAKKNSAANLKQGDKKPDRADSPARAQNGDHATRQAIADRAQVSSHKAKQAQAVHNKDPELGKKVAAGMIPLRVAAKQVNKETAKPKPKTEANTRHAQILKVMVLDEFFLLLEQLDPKDVFNGMTPKDRDNVCEGILPMIHWLNKFLECSFDTNPSGVIQ